MQKITIEGFTVDTFIWEKYQTVLKACDDANICPPIEVTEYFDGIFNDEKVIKERIIEAITRNG